MTNVPVALSPWSGAGKPIATALNSGRAPNCSSSRRKKPERASPSAYRAMGIPIVQGRSFTEADLGPTPVVIISAAAAQRGHEPHVRVFRHVESRGHDAHNQAGFTVDANGTSDEVLESWGPEACPPYALAEAGPKIFAAARWLSTNRCPPALRSAVAFEFEGLLTETCHDEEVLTITGQRDERLLLTKDVGEVRSIVTAVLHGHARRLQHHDAIRVRERERPQQHPVHHAEHRGIGGDAKRKRHNRECRKSRTANKRPGTDAQVIPLGADATTVRAFITNSSTATVWSGITDA
jgi:hypothetical protein